MAYSNYAYPAGYQPTAYRNPYGSPTPVPAPQSTGIIWVQGEAGAKSFLVAPNTTVQLWDSEDQVIYLKSADASGMPSMRVLDYKERAAEIPAIDARNDDIDDMQKQIDKIKCELDDIRSRLEER